MSGRCLGILGGSGLYGLQGLTSFRELPTPETPFGAASGVVSEGELAGARLVFLPRHGAGHRIAAHEVNYRANVYALKAAGADQLLSVSAVGSLREDIVPGDVLLVDQYVDMTRQRPQTFFEGTGVVAHVGLAQPTDAALRRALSSAAREAGARTHEHGTYVCIEGPQFSTRAESELYRRWQLDVIGMTNMPEARLAREAELPYASLCLVTDFDCWHHSEAPVEVATVIAQLRRNAVLAARIINLLLSRLPDPTESPASRALDTGLLTALEHIGAAGRARLGLLLARRFGQGGPT